MEKSVFVDQRAAAVRQFLAAYRDDLARQGSVVTTWRRRDGRRLGPYHLLCCRDRDGRQRAVYLGAAGALVESARQALAVLQAPLRHERQTAAVRRQLRQAVRESRKALDQELASVGLTRHGAEVRGWSKVAP